MKLPPTVLLVDDEEGIRVSGTFLLNKMGSQVLEAESGQRGLELYMEALEKPDILLTDINCCGRGAINGVQLAREVLRVNPDQVIVFMTGLLGNRYGMHDLAEISPYFLQKPFGQEKLREMIARILADSARLALKNAQLVPAA